MIWMGGKPTAVRNGYTDSARKVFVNTGGVVGTHSSVFASNLTRDSKLIP